MILSVAYDIVRINLLKMYTLALGAAEEDRRAGADEVRFPVQTGEKKRRNLEMAIFSLAFSERKGYTSVVNNLLSALRTDILL